jgi:hypothetical protein
MSIINFLETESNALSRKLWTIFPFSFFLFRFHLYNIFVIVFYELRKSLRRLLQLDF